jgi:hypothetical protein
VESSCECGNEPLGSIKCWETNRVAAQLVASPVVLTSRELVTYLNMLCRLCVLFVIYRVIFKHNPGVLNGLLSWPKCTNT